MSFKVIEKALRIIFWLIVFNVIVPLSGIIAEVHPIRVNLFPQGTNEFRLKVNGSYQIKDDNTGQILLSQGTTEAMRVNGGTHGLWLGQDHYLTNHLIVNPEKDGSIEVNGKSYRGEMHLLVISTDKVIAVNHLELEDYLRGVLAGEMPKRWPVNALSAQAIAARTYALFQKGINQDQLYDVTADVSSQVYGGIANETYVTDQIVRDTEGVVMVYDHMLIPAFYHSCCGGKTEIGSQVFDIRAPPLRSVSCQYCSNSPNYTWSYTMTTAEILRIVQRRFDPDAQMVLDIRILRKTSSGRNDIIEIKTDQNTFEISAHDFRLLADPRMIKSTYYRMRTFRDKVIFHGRGWGHGVGLCQWGAKGLSENKLRTEEILAYYYHAMTLVRIQ